MSTFLGVPVDAAYHVVSAFAHVLTPLLGGLAAAAAIVLFTMAVRLLVMPLSYRAMRGMDAQARMAPQVQALRTKHARHPERLQRELTALYKAEGTSMFAGFAPLLLQWPFLSVMYLLFRTPKIGGVANTLLSHDLFGAALGSHWLSGAGPLSAQGAVFAGLFVLLAAVGWLSGRATRRATSTAGTSVAVTENVTGRKAATGRADAGRTGAGRAHADRAGAGRAGAGRADANRVRAGRVGVGQAGAGGAGAVRPTGSIGVLTRLIPYISVVIAAFVPLAAGLYLATTAGWTLAERTLLRRSKPSQARSA
jgi:YidC/Oxa1 family membrane protein insertase